jgi:hypothetical protein
MNRKAGLTRPVEKDPKQTWRLPQHGERYRFLQRELSVGSAEISLDLIQWQRPCRRQASPQTFNFWSIQVAIE